MASSIKHGLEESSLACANQIYTKWFSVI